MTCCARCQPRHHQGAVPASWQAALPELLHRLRRTCRLSGWLLARCQEFRQARRRKTRRRWRQRSLQQSCLQLTSPRSTTPSFPFLTDCMFHPSPRSASRLLALDVHRSTCLLHVWGAHRAACSATPTPRQTCSGDGRPGHHVNVLDQARPAPGQRVRVQHQSVQALPTKRPPCKAEEV